MFLLIRLFVSILHNFIQPHLFLNLNFFHREQRNESLNSCKELALVYHRLNQICLTSNESKSLNLILALNSVNMAEASASVMNCTQLTEIYINVALTIKHVCPSFLKGIHR